MDRQLFQELAVRRRKIYDWLLHNDWKINKHTLGEWKDDDPRWIEYLEDRKKYREELDEIESQLSEVNND